MNKWIKMLLSDPGEPVAVEAAQARRQRITICATVVICCLLLAVVDGYIRPPYAVKAAGKIVLFLAVPMALMRKELLPVLRPDKKALTLGLILGILVMALILGGYAILNPWLDLSAVPAAMEANGGITEENFLWVASYVAFCNSLLEEIFFRGFAFLTLRKVSSRGFAYVVSAAGFSLYHAAIVDGWVLPLLFGLMLLGLFFCGIFFNRLDEGRGRIWVSWPVHMCANLAINAVGLIVMEMV